MGASNSFGGGPDVLLAAMDRVHDAVLDCLPPDVIASRLDDLARLCAEHFATEERVLRRYGYSHDARTARHARLLKRIPDLGNRIRAGERKSAGIANLLHRLSEQAGYQERSAA